MKDIALQGKEGHAIQLEFWEPIPADPRVTKESVLPLCNLPKGSAVGTVGVHISRILESKIKLNKNRNNTLICIFSVSLLQVLH
jgi:hypothetical protein